MSLLRAPGLFAIGTGLLLFLASPGFFGLAPLAWIALVPLLRACRPASVRQSAALGLLGGMVYYLPLLSWVIIVLSRYGQLPMWLSIMALTLLALYMSLYLALFAAGLAWLGRRFSPLWTAPVLWVALDFIRSWLFTGFPWQDLAYSQFQFPLLIQAADLAGHSGVTFLIVLANALIATLLARKRFPITRPLSLGAAVLLLAASPLYGGIRLRQMEEAIGRAPVLPVTVVQGNIAQDRKWTPAFRKHTIEIYRELTEEALRRQQSSLVIWPETALPFYPHQDPLFPELITQLVRPAGINLLTGSPRQEQAAGNPESRYFNSALLLSADGRIAGIYDKQHLVPFGEYIPLRRLFPFPGPLVETIADFTPGAAIGPVSCEGLQIGVLICFESIFPELARLQTDRGAGLLVNMTNDAWFGRSNAPWQHFSMAVLRAVENRRSLARAANTGISGFIDPTGRPAATTNLFTPAYANDQVPLLTVVPFYVRHGHLFAPGCLILIAGLGLFVWRRPGRDSRG